MKWNPVLPNTERDSWCMFDYIWSPQCKKCWITRRIVLMKLLLVKSCSFHTSSCATTHNSLSTFAGTCPANTSKCFKAPCIWSFSAAVRSNGLKDMLTSYSEHGKMCTTHQCINFLLLQSWRYDGEPNTYNFLSSFLNNLILSLLIASGSSLCRCLCSLAM